MNTKQIVVVFVVAVIVIAAAAVVLSRNNGDDSTPPVSGEVQSGAFYGNVNGDSRVDETDKSVIESIIDGEYTLEDYPLADANLDGVVDQNDLDVVDPSSTTSRPQSMLSTPPTTRWPSHTPSATSPSPPEPT